MLKKDISVKVTHFMVRLCYFLLSVVAVALPFMLYSDFFMFEVFSNIKSVILIPFYMIPFYAVLPAGFTALVCLDKLLINIKRDEVFEMKNVRILHIISIACLYAGIVGLVTFIVALCYGLTIETFLVLSMGEFFMALVVRVVRNIFDTAITIKQENELTI